VWWEHPLFVVPVVLAAFVAGIGTVWGKGIVPMWRGLKRFGQAVRKFADAMDTLFVIAAEFKPNGGTSLHDRLVKIEDGFVKIEDGMLVAQIDRQEIKRQVELIITEELPIITALAERVLEAQPAPFADPDGTPV